MFILYEGDLRPGAKPASSSSRSCMCRRAAAINSAQPMKKSVTLSRYSARLDLTDLFVSASPESAGKTVLIVDVKPFMTRADFRPDPVYSINVDNEGDTLADAAFPLMFSESNGSSQTRTAYDATSACC